MIPHGPHRHAASDSPARRAVVGTESGTTRGRPVARNADAVLPTETTMLLNWNHVGVYELSHRVGRGRSGEVWRGHRSGSMREVALKVFFEPLEDKNAFYGAAESWSPLGGDADNVVPFLHADIDRDRAYVVSEFRAHGSLKDWLQEHGGRAPSYARAVEILSRVLHGLEQLHGHGILHGDLKPSNVLRYEGEWQLIDFGMSHVLDLNKTDMVYEAPEIAEGASSSVASDLWSAGAIFYELVTGRLPCAEELSIRHLNQQVPNGLRTILRLALSRKVSERFSSAREFLKALKVRAPFVFDAQSNITASTEKRRGLATPISSAGITRTPHVTDLALATEQVVESYRQTSMEFCANINLVNLPDTDLNITKRTLQIQQLYVALRVHSAAAITGYREPSRDETRRAGVGDGFELEKRRLFDRLISAGRRPPTEGLQDSGPAVFIGERLSASRRLVLLGDPGAGKTTLIKWLATVYLLGLKNDPCFRGRPDVCSLPDKDWLPIIIRCRDLDSKALGGSVDELLFHTLNLAAMAPQQRILLRDVLRERLETDRAILLVDGLDEITDLAARRSFWRMLCLILRKVRNATVVVTSRIVGYRAMGLRISRHFAFEHVVVADLSHADKDRFAKQWASVTERPEHQDLVAQELIHSVHSSECIERLTGNPMLLTTLALVKRRFNKLPRNRASLYAEALQVVLAWRSAADAPLESPEALPQVEYLAYAMCSRGLHQLREGEILGLLQQMRIEYPNLRQLHAHSPEVFLKLLSDRTGLLVHVGETDHFGQSAQVYEFRHLTFQEYLAGLALVHGFFPNRNRHYSLAENVRRLVESTSEQDCNSGSRERVVSENWREAIRFCVASCQHDVVDEVLQAVLVPGDEECWELSQSRAVLGALCLADEPHVSDQVASQTLHCFLGIIEQHDGQEGTSTSVNQVVHELGKSAFRDLLQEQLLEAFRQESSVKRERFGVLFAVNSYHTAPEGGKALERWLDDRVRELGGNEVQTISACLAIMEVGYHGKPNMRDGSAEQLLALLDRGGAAAHAAAWALQYLRVRKGKKCMPWDAEPTALERLTKLVANASADQRAVVHAAQILGRKQFVPAIPALIERLSGADGTDVVYAACRGLVAIGTPAIEPLMAALDGDPDPYLRGWASAVLEQLDPDDVHWEKYLNDGIRAIRCKALGRLLRRAGIDGIERQLLSRNLDGKPPWLDPADMIGPQRLEEAAKILQTTYEDVQNRYRSLAQRFSLLLRPVKEQGPA
jgi:serine/threonine protein kinase